MNVKQNLAVVFPGQGSQSLGMMNALNEFDPEVKLLFDEASESLGFDLWRITVDGPEEKLNSTEITQPALLAAGFAAWKVWHKNSNAQPALIAGHSLGEYTALVCSGVIKFNDAIKLVSERGKLMQSAVPQGQGAMAAVLGLEDTQVEEICQSVAENEIVSAANYNSPGQIVIAGARTAVERAITAAKDAGSKRSIMLPVSVPSHCMLMKDAASKLAEYFETISIKDAETPIVQNVDATARTEAEEIRNIILEQLYKPVRWVDVISFMTSQGVDTIIECGPGKVLTGLCKRINKELKLGYVQDENSLFQAKKLLEI